MMLKQPIQHVFVQLSETLNQLSNEEYVQPSQILCQCHHRSACAAYY